jgi:phospholysine phosphohistidine inorganic pyrophosphate phosphatase
MPSAFLIDLDGTLYTDAGAVSGGPATLARLRAGNIPFRCLTNTTTQPRSGLLGRLLQYGYDVRLEEILTPVSAAVAHCRARGLRRVLPLIPEAARADLAGLDLVSDDTPDAALLGDLGEAWTFGLLQQAFLAVTAGAEMVALSRDRYFQRRGQLTLDAGPFVAALEYATGAVATLVGKPSAAYYQAALGSLGVSPDGAVMVGDDLWSDVQGAERAGIRAWLVRTGKFREEAFRNSGIVPARVIDSVADVLRES